MIRTTILAFALVVSAAAKADGPDTVAIINEVRMIVAVPDEWADMTGEIQKLNSLAKCCNGEKKREIEGFGRNMASYGTYFSEHPFTLSAVERSAFSAVIRAYEERIGMERKRLLASWREHPDQQHGNVDASSLALLPADHELERCASVFARHNPNKSRPNELAGVVIGVIREYGRLFALLTEEPNHTAEPASPSRGGSS
jgi:hypothetical protein